MNAQEKTAPGQEGGQQLKLIGNLAVTAGDASSAGTTKAEGCHPLRFLLRIAVQPIPWWCPACGTRNEIAGIGTHKVQCPACGQHGQVVVFKPSPATIDVEPELSLVEAASGPAGDAGDDRHLRICDWLRIDPVFAHRWRAYFDTADIKATSRGTVFARTAQCLGIKRRAGDPRQVGSKGSDYPRYSYDELLRVLSHLEASRDFKKENAIALVEELERFRMALPHRARFAITRLHPHERFLDVQVRRIDKGNARQVGESVAAALRDTPLTEHQFESVRVGCGGAPPYVHIPVHGSPAASAPPIPSESLRAALESLAQFQPPFVRILLNGPLQLERGLLRVTATCETNNSAELVAQTFAARLHNFPELAARTQSIDVIGSGGSSHLPYSHSLMRAAS